MLNITSYQGNANPNHFIPIRMAIVKNKQKITSIDNDAGKLVHSWWECKIVQPLWKTIAIPQKIKFRITI